ncbi:hypothetical protein CBER1_10089 [Cercospora berteroae]|uniref:Major facilitator superfamily (MFS) profile domain-containing protein n=1 Tax=Cercospora berteroae TaxID=357750 RepID=A0A2S6BWV5_9PEZI|nr:hypothetical protein CBER1_10089 [Cercospora berteroae]
MPTFNRAHSGIPLLLEERKRDDANYRTSTEEGHGLMGERTVSQEEEDHEENEVPGYDSEGATLSAMERKYRMVDTEIDAHGMGRYQWIVWSLCGLGYLLDLLWSQAFGLVLGPLQQEMGFSDEVSGSISVAFSTGLTAGAFFWGIMGDVIGRRWVFNLTCMFSGAFGLGLGFVTVYWQFLALVVVIGFGIGGNIPVDTTICLEFLPSNRRFLLALLSIFQPIGVVGTSAIAYAFVPSHSCSPDFSRADALPSCKNVAEGVACCSSAQNMGWRYVLYTIGGVNVLVFILRCGVIKVQESPKFLLSQGNDEAAIRVLQAVARKNGRECTLRLRDFERADAEDESDAVYVKNRMELTDKNYWKGEVKKELGKYKKLFAGKEMFFITILVWLTYICDFFGFTLAGYYFPKIIAIKNSEIDVSLEQTYRNYVAIYSPGIIGVVLGAMMTRMAGLGKKWTMTISSGLMGLSIIFFSMTNSPASNIGLNAMEYFFQSMFNAVLYGFTPEVFPAEIRGTATGLATTWGRLFSILAPIIAQSMQKEEGLKDPETVKKFLYMAGGITLGCVFTTGLLPSKWKKR